MILWRVVLVQTLAHTLVVVPVTVFWASVEMSNFFQAFIVKGIASPAAVKQVQSQVRALVFWSPVTRLEHDGWGKHAVDWFVFKFMEVIGILARKEKDRIG